MFKFQRYFSSSQNFETSKSNLLSRALNRRPCFFSSIFNVVSWGFGLIYAKPRRKKLILFTVCAYILVKKRGFLTILLYITDSKICGASNGYKGYMIRPFIVNIEKSFNWPLWPLWTPQNDKPNGVYVYCLWKLSTCVICVRPLY